MAPKTEQEHHKRVQHHASNVSQDLVWEIVRTSAPVHSSDFLVFANDFPGPNNAYLVKRKSGGGSQFSKDPYNLMNKHSRKVRRFNASGTEKC